MALTVESEGPIKITRATIEAAWKRRRKAVRLVVRDAECRGLALVVNPTGMMWRYDFKPRGTNPRTGRRWPSASVSIGTPESHSPDKARQEANRHKGSTVTGRDPAAERRAKLETAEAHAAAVVEAERQRIATDTRRAATALGVLVNAYAAVLPTRPKLRGAGLPGARHALEDAARARAAIKAMDAIDRPVADLTARDVRAMLDADAARPARARAMYGSLSRFLDWCMDAEHIEVNVCAGVPRQRRPKVVQARSHYLTLPEMARLWRAADGLEFLVWRDFVRFLIAVPCRRGEAAALNWADLDLPAAEWRQAAGTTKNGEAHRLHLHPLALHLLRARHESAGKPDAGLVFLSPAAGVQLSTFSQMKVALDGKAGLTGWRWHDFRRSFATALGEAGVAEAVADAILNHKQSATRGGVLGVYQRAQRWPEQVKAVQVWGTALAAALAVRPIPIGAGDEMPMLHR